MSKKISVSPGVLKTAMTYEDYFIQLQKRVEEAKQPSTQKEELYLHYYLLGFKRMKRLNKKAEVTPETQSFLSKMNQKQTWLVITEGWCGDAAHSLPYLDKMSRLNKNISLQLIYRDNNDVINNYLTNGGKSIPKLIAFDRELNELFTWGPRPDHIQDSYLRMKKDKMPFEDITKSLQLLYNEDKGETLQKEICLLLQKYA